MKVLTKPRLMPDKREPNKALLPDLMIEKEKTILAGCLHGEKAAWDAFVLQYSGLVYHTIKKTFILYHAEPRPDLAEDLYQEFFLSLLRDDFKKLSQFRGDQGCSLASWLRVIASRLTIDFLRRRTATPVEIADGRPVADPDPTDFLIDGEKHKLVAQVLQSLAPRDRILIDLCYRQALPPAQVAAILKTSVSALYTQKSRILDKIRESLRKSASL